VHVSYLSRFVHVLPDQPPGVRWQPPASHCSTPSNIRSRTSPNWGPRSRQVARLAPYTSPITDHGPSAARESRRLKQNSNSAFVPACRLKAEWTAHLLCHSVVLRSNGIGCGGGAQRFSSLPLVRVPSTSRVGRQAAVAGIAITFDAGRRYVGVNCRAGASGPIRLPLPAKDSWLMARRASLRWQSLSPSVWPATWRPLAAGCIGTAAVSFRGSDCAAQK
jgi:hypothetical protein